MSQDKKLYRVLNNSFVLIGGSFFNQLVNFLAGILIARSLGSGFYGEWSFIFVFLSFFEMFAEFGLNSILTRQIAQEKEKAPQILGNAILFRLFLAAVTVPAAIFLIRMLNYPVSVEQGVLLASFQLFLTVRSVYETIFRVNLLMAYPTLLNGLRALLNLALVAAISCFHPTVSFFILAALISGFAGFAAIIFFSRRFVSIRFRPDWNLIKGFVKESAPLLFSGYLTLLYYRIDVLMISKMKGFADVGYYSVATRLTESLGIIAVSFLQSLFPLLAHSFKENRSEFESLVSRAYEGLLLIGLPIALGGGLVAGDLIVFCFGAEYARSGPTLGILFGYVFFSFLGSFLVNLLIVCGRQIVDAWISFFLVLINIGLNCLLIPSHSYNGAAAATVLTEIAGISVMLAYVARDAAIRLRFPLRELVLSLKVNLPYFLLLLILKRFFPMPVLVFIGLSALLYGFLLFVLRILAWKDFKNYFSQIFKTVSGP